MLGDTRGCSAEVEEEEGKEEEEEEEGQQEEETYKNVNYGGGIC